MRVVVAVTGASGVIYARRLLEALKEKGVTTELIVSRTAIKIIEQELDMSVEAFGSIASRKHDVDDLLSPLASGSYKVDAVVVVPCSMKTLAAAASGYSENLITRAIDVAIKERRKVIFVPREAPVSSIHLENMLKLARLGASIIPAAPGFYRHPRGIDDLVEFIVDKILGMLEVERHGPE